MSAKIVRFLKNHDVTDFEGLSYGPFYENIKYALPVDVANLLIKLGVAEDTRNEALEPSLKQVFKGEVLTGFVEAGKSKGLFPEKKQSKAVKDLIAEVDALLKEMGE